MRNTIDVLDDSLKNNLAFFFVKGVSAADTIATLAHNRHLVSPPFLVTHSLVKGKIKEQDRDMKECLRMIETTLYTTDREILFDEFLA